MIIALEIGTVLSLAAMIAVYISNLPKPRRVPIRVRNRGPHQR